ncbi:tripartite tricarboxylate transporter substrate binding protein [Celeribacter sp. PS-C1]|uniref:Bug family tripartite tricarboxylate transporter substrate binding protein n=1 Tax=Celeribacter sp. PS-C1 TaxID=2820813 RepID=UPI001CA4D964|nr:tripartite tricarboxylate transporter substrate binding protein [Celeribacter sp. PS-C1]MBW6419339.1 tripartite tricarboxylate transporter substrate binding protein [Celeribacter sp. PS-C1]
MRAFLKSFVLGAAVTLSGSAAFAADDDFPRKPVSMIVAYSPGGGTDTAARILANYMDKHLGQRMIIRNKPGAGGQVGFSELARADNDGYTIGFINVPSIFLVKMMRDNVPFEMSDFEPIGNIQLDPVVLTVPADSPYNTFEEFVTAAKAEPGALTVGGDGPQSNNQLQLVVAEDALEMDVNFVPFSGSGPAITATLGNQVDASIPSASSAASQVTEGRLKALAVFASQRYPYLPDVPTVAEATGVDVKNIGAAMRGVAVPKGIDPERKAVLEAAFRDVVNDPEFIAHIERLGLPLAYMTADEFGSYLSEAEAEISGYIELLK